MKTLITTTIHIPHVLTQWAETLDDDDFIIVAGDVKTPHQEVSDLLTGIRASYGINTEYLHPESDRQAHRAISPNIGFNSVQRRNLALLAAMELEPDYIITIDDDNAPTQSDQLTQLENLFVRSDFVLGVRTDDGWYDAAGELSNAENAWGGPTIITHRGYPQEFRFADEDITEVHNTGEWPIGVAAMLWEGDPDIDAAERFTHRPKVTSVAGVRSSGVKLLPGTWCPFNSQATMYRGDLAPLMFVWPHVGRYDDIWASFLARRVMDHLGYAAYYGHPVVNTAQRNDHDIINDLEAEMFGMRHNKTIIDIIRSVEFNDSHSTVIDCMAGVYQQIQNVWEHMPSKLDEAFSLWFDDLNDIGVL